jgi:hypothetical protein
VRLCENGRLNERYRGGCLVIEGWPVGQLEAVTLEVTRTPNVDVGSCEAAQADAHRAIRAHFGWTQPMSEYIPEHRAGGTRWRLFGSAVPADFAHKKRYRSCSIFAAMSGARLIL